MPQPFFPWIGGKRRLAKHILPAFPPHQCYVEPFAGDAALYFMKEPAHVEVLNDINGELVNLYRVVQHHLEEFLRQFRWALSSRQIFEWQRTTAPEMLTDIQRAARFYYIQKLCFGGKATGQTFGTAATVPPRLNLLRMEEDLSAAHLRLALTFVEHLPWRQCVAKYDRPETLFYIDPPYHQTEGYGVPFPEEEYYALAEVVRGLQGKAIVSLNDTPLVRRAFRGLPTTRVAIQYTVGGRTRSKAPSAELIIRSWSRR